MTKIIQDSNFHKLYETPKFIAGHVFEYAYLVRKQNYLEIYMGDFYGDPCCGLIDSNNNWCLVGGDTITVWTKNTGLIEIRDRELSWVCKVRQVSDYGVELLIDPNSDNGAIWALNIQTLERHKIKEYKLDSKYSDNIDW
jgi:hypothetical protein